jgi:hypothetical protein
MRDEQWQLTYPASGRSAGASFLFGTYDTNYVTLKRPTIEPSDPRTDDQDNVSEDGRRFGRDFTGGMTLTFDVGVDTVDTGSLATFTQDNLDAVDRMRAAWKADALRGRPGAVATLTGMFGGRTAVLYGRPRGFQITEARFQSQGYTGVLAQFVSGEDLFYDGTEQARTVTIAASISGGLMDPLAEPLMDDNPTDAQILLDVGGTNPTWPVVTLYGPGVNLAVEFVGLFTVGISGTLSVGQTATVDPRPWARTVLSQSRGSLAGRLFGAVRLRDMRLPPGNQEAVLRGTDATGTARATIRWRNARTYL